MDKKKFKNDKSICPKIGHIINPFVCAKDNPSYLYYAQPITFKSMFLSQQEARKDKIDIELFTVNFPEDDLIIPKYFTKLPHLKKSTQSEFPEISGKRKLPIIQEIFDSILKNTDVDFIIFTNSDIGVQKEFYKKINELITKDNLKSFVINRRDALPKFKDQHRLTEDDLEVIYKEKGVRHIGKDCFIISRKILSDINMNLMFTGYPPWGNTLFEILKSKDKGFKIFKKEYLTFHIGSDNTWVKSKSPLLFKNKEISEIVRKSHNLVDIKKQNITT